MLIKVMLRSQKVVCPFFSSEGIFMNPLLIPMTFHGVRWHLKILKLFVDYSKSKQSYTLISRDILIELIENAHSSTLILNAITEKHCAA